MKRILLSLTLVLIAVYATAQRANRPIESGYIVASDFAISKPVSEIAKEFPVDPNGVIHKKEKESGDREGRKPQQFEFSVKDDPIRFGNDTRSMQRSMGDIPSGGLKANWPGQTATGFRPYDPSGAAGPNHYVQMINSTTFKVFDKASGSVLLTATLGNLWTPATANAGDPIVMYDKAADRWFLAQFGNATDKKIYIAISTTPDPTGTYYTYTYTSPQFPDYLKFGVWSDGYYMTSNQTQKVFAFERDAMLAGNAAARAVYTGFTPPQGTGFFVPMPGCAADGDLPAVGTPCPIFSYSDNGWGATYSDAVNIYQMAVDWTPTIPVGTITLAGNVPTAAFDATYNASWNDCSQPGTTQKLDGIGGIVMYRTQWKKWDGYNSVVLNWAVQISATQRSIKWCELRQDQATGVWSMYQEGIYTPDAATRWMGSIAMDKNGSIGLSYIKSDATSIFPGLYYTGRRACDPLGTLPLTETLIAAGTGSQTGSNRVGDYAQTVLDPDGVTFWSTGEFMGGASGSSAATTRVFSFNITPCTTDASVLIAVTSGANPTCNGAAVTFTATPGNGGTAPAYQWKLDGVDVGTNNSSYTLNAPIAGQVVSCVMTSNQPGVTANPATSNTIVISQATPVTPSVSIALTSGTNPTCPGLTVGFTATPVNGGASPSYQWKLNGTNVGTNSPTYSNSTIANGALVTCVMTSNAGCLTIGTATSNSITVNHIQEVSPTVSITQTAGGNPLCSGSLATFQVNVTNANTPAYQWKVDGINVGTNSPTYSASSWTNGQAITCVVTSAAQCSRIATLGTGVNLNATTSGAGVAYPTRYGNGRQQYLIRATELTALGLAAGNISSLAFRLGATVGNPATLNGYTVKLGTTASTVATTTFNTAALTTVFGPVNYTPTVNALNTHTFAAPFYWNGTSNLLVDLCFSNGVTGYTAYQSYLTTSTFTSTTYYQADGAAGAIACTRATGSTTTSRPNITFTMAGNPQTATSNAVTVAVVDNLNPSISIAITSGSQPSCAGENLTFTASGSNGGSAPVYQWKVDGIDVGTNSAVYSSSALANGQVVSCSLTSNSACATIPTAVSNSVTVSVNANVQPAIQINSDVAGVICSGNQVTFTAVLENGGSAPVYNWKIDGVSVGNNTSVYVSSALLDGQSISCSLISNAFCAGSSAVNSNDIVVDVAQPEQPTVVNCWDNYQFNAATCSWTNVGQQPLEPTAVNCWDNYQFDTTSCQWINLGSQPQQPQLECWEEASLNSLTCEWEVTGSQPEQPEAVNCWDKFEFSATSCSWVNLGSQPQQPALACWEEAVFNSVTCQWEVSGSQAQQPEAVNCWDNFQFDSTSCNWINAGLQPVEPQVSCWQSTEFNSATCEWVVTGEQPVQPAAVNCWDNYQFNTASCSWLNEGAQPQQPEAVNCWDNYQFDTTSCQWFNAGSQSEQPQLACWELATFNSLSCEWEVTGSQPEQPEAVNCWDNFEFSTSSCSWENIGSQPQQPALACWEEAVFNSVACQWEVSGAQAQQPEAVNCWDDFQFDTTSCNWINAGAQPAEPQLTCWQSTEFNSATCEWVVTGEQPAQPAVVNCWDNYQFDSTSCSWVNAGSQEPQPNAVNCWDNYQFNTTSCSWVNAGSQEPQPIAVNCWDDYQFNTTSCSWVNEGSQPLQPAAVNCWDNYQFNTASCSWVNAGSQEPQPTAVNCWDDYQFSTASCSWVNVGSQEPQPAVVNCWDNFQFSTSSCSWVNEGLQPLQPAAVNCWDNYQFNTASCSWVNAGTQEPQPIAVNCWDDYQFNTISCSWVNEGSQPLQPAAVNCWDNYQFNTTSCSWVNAGSQEPQPTAVNCWDNYQFNTASCSWVNAGSQPSQPTAVNCWDNYQFNTTSCSWVNAGSQPLQPAAVNCWDNYQFNTASCSWVNAGVQPQQPAVVNCWDNFQFYSNTCSWSNIGVPTTYYADADGDGFGNANITILACTVPAGYSANNTDCNDAVSTTYPGATEVCNNTDDDCDALIDEGLGVVFYADADGDGYGNAAITTIACAAPAGYVAAAGDCNDQNNAINPGTSEICGNSVDENCSGVANENCCPITPSATAAISNAMCAALANGSIDASVTANVPSYSVQWSNGSNQVDIQNLLPGSYTITISDANGCQGSSTFVVGNNNQTTATPTSIAGPYGACRNTSNIEFTTPAIAGATSYVWALPTGATGTSTTNSIVVSFSSTFVTGNISVRAVGPCGSSALYSRALYALTGIPVSPSAIIGPTVNVCAGSTQTYSCTAVTAAATYFWTVPANSTIVSGQGTQSITVAFDAGFVSSGIVGVRADNCFGQSATRTITVYSIPSTPLSITGNSNNLCPGNVLTYSVAAVAGASSYVWTAPTNTTIVSGQGTASITLSVGASFNSGTLSVVSVSSCGQSVSRTLGLNKAPAAVSAMTGQNTNLCGGGQFTYSVTAVSGLTYNWTVPAGCTIVTNSGNSIVLNVTSSFTAGTLSVQAVNACGSSATRSLTLSRLPAAPASITGAASVCPGQVGVVFSTPAVSGVTQLWTVPTGAVITAGQGTTGMTCTWGSTAGNVTLKSVNACGQSVALTKAVTLLACMPEAPANPVEARMAEVNIYPNPNQGAFTIHATKAGYYRLMNSTGQLVHEIQLNDSNNFSFEISGLSTGFYFLQGVSGSDYVQQKIVVTNR